VQLGFVPGLGCATGFCARIRGFNWVLCQDLGIQLGFVPGLRGSTGFCARFDHIHYSSRTNDCTINKYTNIPCAASGHIEISLKSTNISGQFPSL